MRTPIMLQEGAVMAEPITPQPHALLREHKVPLGIHIGGAWEKTGRHLDVVNPSTGDVIASVSDGDASDGIRALDAAVAAQDGWRRMPARARADLFHSAHRLLVSRADAFADVMTLESGKPRAESVGEFALSMGFFQWYAEQIAHIHGTYATSSSGGFRVMTTKQPVGPALLITPWNFPMLMNARKGGAALAAGCTVVLKSASETPLTAALFVSTLEEAGFPPGVVNLIHTSDSASISAPLLADQRLRKVSFTGSTAVGSILLAQSARNIVNASMELGGDGPFIVLDDANIDLAVREAVNCKFRNAGQACVAANRIILHRDIAEEFTEKFLAAAKALTVGDGFDKNVVVGPMINARQRERTGRLVEDFQNVASATLLLGGKPIEGDGFFFEPTVLSFPDKKHDFCNEEIFAPVAALYTVDSVSEALEFANDTHYGLAAYLFTSEISRAITLAERLDFGMVGINRGIMAEPSAPFGGVKSSGLGREGGHEGLDDFLEPKYIALTVDESFAQ
ncbi:Succinate-semialdehyde dehydrogenase [NAD(P)+] [Leifsonia rubra CMS 76R]|nr:Succinate-semialdehyde dehydrogenase [NAD(P)+] [Leifsonia rubra CMS 76R]